MQAKPTPEPPQATGEPSRRPMPYKTIATACRAPDDGFLSIVPSPARGCPSSRPTAEAIRS